MQRSACLFMVVAAVLAGCRLGTSSSDELDREYPVARLTTLSPAGMAEALDALREAVGGRVRITMMRFGQQSLTIIAQNPRAPANFDSYSIRKGDIDRSALKTSRDSEQRMAADLFDLDSVPLDRLGELALKAMTALPMDGAHVSGVSVDRTSEGTLEISVSLASERRNGRVVYDAKGQLLSAKAD